jgi:flagellar hook-associated protein 3 FlgL
VYAGTRNTQPPYTVATDAAGHVTSVTYNGNTSVARVDIAEGAAVAAAPPGPDAIGADFFNNLIALQNHLLAGDTAAITATDQPALAASEDLLLTQMAANGVFQARLTTADTIARNQIEALNADASRLADADLTDSVLLLTQTRTAYQAALQTGGSLLQVSLLDYLR